MTGQLNELKDYQGVPLDYVYFDAAIEKLVRYLNEPVDINVIPTPTEQVSEVQRKIEEAAEVPSPTEAQLSAEDYFYRGYAKHESGDLEGAIADYTEAIHLNPQFAEAYNNRGAARAKQGDHIGSIDDFSKTINLKPRYTTAYCNRGISRRFVGDIKGAIADFNRAIRFNPQYADAYCNRGLIYFTQDKLKAAIADYTRAILFNPQHAKAFSNRAEACYLKGDKNEAQSNAEEAIRLDSTLDDPYKYRGHIRRERGDLPGALADYEKYLELGGGERNGDREEIERLIEELRGQIG